LTFPDDPAVSRLFWRVVSQAVEFTAADFDRLTGT
jgi:hypothetical protein